MVIALLGIICGCESWEEIHDYGETKKKWLKTFLTLKKGIPSADTIRRLFERIKPEEMEKMYREWVLPYVGSCLQKQVCIDGKTVRGAGGQLHVVSAWIREDGITLGQVKTDEKSNEITAIPELLETLDIKGGIVTIDAMGCQRKISQKVIEQEANYLFAVKLNQPTLYEEISEYFQWAVGDEVESKILSRFEVAQKGHGRISRWRVTASSEVAWFESKSDWVGLTSVYCSTTKPSKHKQNTRQYGIIDAREKGKSGKKPCTRGREAADVQAAWRANKRIGVADIFWRRTT